MLVPGQVAGADLFPLLLGWLVSALIIGQLIGTGQALLWSFFR